MLVAHTQSKRFLISKRNKKLKQIVELGLSFSRLNLYVKTNVMTDKLCAVLVSAEFDSALC